MFKTFKIKTINGHHYQLLTLPGTNLFRYEIVNTIGSNIERAFNSINGGNIHGIAHLVEHLGFRIPRDFSTNQLLSLLKTQGTYNAATDHDQIVYYFKTTMDRVDLATQLVCNYAFNDLKKITNNEFQTEKMVVYNEVKQYADDDQTMFFFNTTSALCDYSVEDNVLGTTETVEAITLDQAIAVKDVLLSCGKHIHNVTYDPMEMTEEEIIGKIETQLATWPSDANSEDHPAIIRRYHQLMGHPRVGKFSIPNESEQHMTAISLDVVTSSIASGIGNNYLAYYADSSLTDVIRDQNGLTYGVSMFEARVSHKSHTAFSCDVTRGTEEKLMELFEQSINDSVNQFSPTEHQKLTSTLDLQRTLAFVNQEKYNGLHWMAINNPDMVKLYADIFEQNVELGYKAIRNANGSYDNITAYLRAVQNAVSTKDYGLVTN